MEKYTCTMWYNQLSLTNIDSNIPTTYSKVNEFVSTLTDNTVNILF